MRGQGYRRRNCTFGDGAAVAGQRCGAQGRVGGPAERHGPALPQSVAQHLAAVPHLRQARAPGPEPSPDPRARRELEGGQRDDLGVQAAEGRQVPRRLAVHRRRRALLLRARAQRPELAVELRPLPQGQDGGEGRRLYRSDQDRDAAAAGPERPLDHLHRLQVGRLRRQDGGLQRRQGRRRHRPLQVRRVRAGRPHRHDRQREATGAASRPGTRSPSGRSPTRRRAWQQSLRAMWT